MEGRTGKQEGSLRERRLRQGRQRRQGKQWWRALAPCGTRMCVCEVETGHGQCWTTQVPLYPCVWCYARQDCLLRSRETPRLQGWPRSTPRCTRGSERERGGRGWARHHAKQWTGAYARPQSRPRRSRTPRALSRRVRPGQRRRALPRVYTALSRHVWRACASLCCRRVCARPLHSRGV